MTRFLILLTGGVLCVPRNGLLAIGLAVMAAVIIYTFIEERTQP